MHPPLPPLAAPTRAPLLIGLAIVALGLLVGVGAVVLLFVLRR